MTGMTPLLQEPKMTFDAKVFTASPETLAEIERLKVRYGVTKNTEVLQRFIAENAATKPVPPTPRVGEAESDGIEPFIFTYRNHRGEIAERRARPIGTRFGVTKWHTKPQWLMRAFDLDKQDEREFAMDDIVTTPHPEAGAGDDVAFLGRVEDMIIDGELRCLTVEELWRWLALARRGASAPVAGGETVAWQWRIPAHVGGCNTWMTEVDEETVRAKMAMWPVTECRPLYAHPPAAPVGGVTEAAVDAAWRKWDTLADGGQIYRDQMKLVLEAAFAEMKQCV